MELVDEGPVGHLLNRSESSDGGETRAVVRMGDKNARVSVDAPKRVTISRCSLLDGS